LNVHTFRRGEKEKRGKGDRSRSPLLLHSIGRVGDLEAEYDAREVRSSEGAAYE
jgi:hypothetical protein